MERDDLGGDRRGSCRWQLKFTSQCGGMFSRGPWRGNCQSEFPSEVQEGKLPINTVHKTGTLLLHSTTVSAIGGLIVSMLDTTSR